MTYKTIKEYYQFQDCLQNSTNWRKISDTVIAIENSIAFPEGGGQLGDRGTVEQKGVKVSFTTTQKDVGIGRIISKPSFPMLSVDGEIHLHLNCQIPIEFDSSLPIDVEVDKIYRAQITRSHTAAHLVVLALKKRFPEIETFIRGCSIEADGGRFDLNIDWPNPNYIEELNQEFIRLVDRNLPVTMTELDSEPECRIWRCDGVEIPCGGTHVGLTGDVGKFTMRKKSKGKSLLRIYFETNNTAELKNNHKGIIAIVDAYGVGIHLPSVFAKKGYSCIHIHSRPFIPKVFALTFRSDFFMEEYFYDGDIDRLCKFLKDRKVSSVLPGVEPGVELAGILSETLGLRTNGSLLGAARRDKFIMQETLRNNGIASIKQLKTSLVEEAIAFAESIGWPIVIKPLRSAGTDGVALCYTSDEIKNSFFKNLGILNKFELRNDELLCQEYLVGSEYVVDTVSRDGKHKVVGIWKYTKLKQNGSAFVYSHMDLIPAEGEISESMTNYTYKVLDTLGICHGAGHSEIILTEHGPVLVETAARTQGGIGSLILNECVGDSQIEMIVDVYTDGERFNTVVNTTYCLKKHCTIVFLISKIGGKISSVCDLNMKKMLSSYHSHDLKFGIGDELPITTDVFTMGGWVALINDKPETIISDIQKIRQYESQGLIYKL